MSHLPLRVNCVSSISQVLPQTYLSPIRVRCAADTVEGLGGVEEGKGVGPTGRSLYSRRQPCSSRFL
mgnify:CR=1 FL=1